MTEWARFRGSTEARVGSLTGLRQGAPAYSSPDSSDGCATLCTSLLPVSSGARARVLSAALPVGGEVEACTVGGSCGRGGCGDGWAATVPWRRAIKTASWAARCLGAAAAQPTRSYMRSPHGAPLRALWAGQAGWRSMGRLQGRTASLVTLPTGCAPAHTSMRTTGADDGRARTAGLEGGLGACAHSAALGQLLQ